jgi:hypothetical protein
MKWNGSRAERKDWGRDVPWRGPTMQRGEVHLRLCAAVQDHAPLAMWGTGVEWFKVIGGVRLPILGSAWVLSRGRVCRIW